MISYVTTFASTITGVGNALSVFAVAFGIIGFAGGAVGYFAKGRSDAIIKAQAELIDVRDRKIADQDSQITALTAERDTLKDTNKTLTGLAQGAPELVVLAKEIHGLPKEVAKIIVNAMKEKRS